METINKKVFLLVLHLTLALALIIYSVQFIPLSSAQQFGVMTIEPIRADLKINEEQIVSVKLNSNSKISGFDLTFHATEHIEIVGFENNLSTSPSLNPFDYKKVMDTNDGSNKRIVYIFTSAQLPNSIDLYLKVKGLKIGQGSITVDTSNSKILDGSAKPIEVTPTTANFNVNDLQSSGEFVAQTSIPQPEYPSTAAIVTIKTKLYGAGNTARVKSTAVAVGRVGEAKYETQFQPFEFVGNGDGTFSGTFAFPNFRDGNKFSLMIKAENYLIRRICDTQPQETKLGEYRCTDATLTIKYGETNNFDFSGISLIPGDLGAPDGILNGYDLSLVRNNFGKETTEAKALADLNHDGKVDEKDLEIIYFSAANTGRKGDL